MLSFYARYSFVSLLSFVLFLTELTARSGRLAPASRAFNGLVFVGCAYCTIHHLASLPKQLYICLAPLSVARHDMEQPWTESEKVNTAGRRSDKTNNTPHQIYLLAEMLKANPIPSHVLMGILRDHNVHPRWNDMALPPGMSTRPCALAPHHHTPTERPCFISVVQC
jgi:hypothetical protein